MRLWGGDRVRVVRLGAPPPDQAWPRATAAAAASQPYPGCLRPGDLPAPIPANPKWYARRQERRALARERADARRLDVGQSSGHAPELSTAEVADPERYTRYLDWRARRLEDQAARFRACTAGAPTLCVDCEWEPAMADRELHGLARTLMRCYGSNRRASRPFELVFSGIERGSRMDETLQRLANYGRWGPFARVSAQPYVGLFPGARLVYLSPDGDGVAEDSSQGRSRNNGMSTKCRSSARIPRIGAGGPSGGASAPGALRAVGTGGPAQIQDIRA
ncbi:unnamed protein product [Prorocentrum cordatum]|uniref:tRNA (guanine(9)-N(1))-methyltransferase n=1 Tax=Prorocentrum cordatum TaxID=2364126 RepID=A0ABN9VJN6_9DINO|nr:unnamed protein product [Polarella glacialis]